MLLHRARQLDVPPGGETVAFVSRTRAAPRDVGMFVPEGATDTARVVRQANFTAPAACPQYAKDGCCNNNQNKYLSFNFLLIGASTPPVVAEAPRAP